MPTSNDPKQIKVPEPDADDQEAQLAAGAAIPPEPDADDPVTGPSDDSWRRPEPAEEPKGYREAQEKATENLNAMTPKAQEPATDEDLRKAEAGKK